VEEISALHLIVELRILSEPIFSLQREKGEVFFNKLKLYIIYIRAGINISAFLDSKTKDFGKPAEFDRQRRRVSHCTWHISEVGTGSCRNATNIDRMMN
jgi:hypothetical protein